MSLKLGTARSALADSVPNASVSRDAETGTLIIAVSCDPFGTNPNGSQLFTLGADGSGLRQLTQLRGLSIGADGTVIGELYTLTSYEGTGPGQ